MRRVFLENEETMEHLAAEATRLGFFRKSPICETSESGDESESANREGGVRRPGFVGVRVIVRQYGRVSKGFGGE